MQQPMFFADLFAEIEPDAPHAPHQQHALPPPPPEHLSLDQSFPLDPVASQDSTPIAAAAAAAHHFYHEPHAHVSVQGAGAGALLYPGAGKDESHLLVAEASPFASADLQPEAQPDPTAVAASAAAPFDDDAAAGVGAPLPPAQDPADAAEHISSGKRRKQELHRRHSKRYRDNLGELFSELEQILPQVLPDCKLKTKSQIIATSVTAVKQLKTEVGTLEMRYVMSSPANRARWVDETVAQATVIQDAIEPFMRLLLGLQAWKHAELWMRVGTSSQLRLERVTSAGRFLDFVKGSQVITFESGDDSLVGRIAKSLQPEWLDLTAEHSLKRFKRGSLALACGLCVCFAVPFLVRGHVVAVVLFYDNTPRTDVLARVSVAQTLAANIGNSFGAQAVEAAQGAGAPAAGTAAGAAAASVAAAAPAPLHPHQHQHQPLAHRPAPL